MKLSKELEGKSIFGIPTGNNARSSTKVIEFQVIKVKRKYFDLVQRGWERNGANSYCPDTGSLESEIRLGYGGNSGYKFFLNLEEALNENRKEKMIFEINNSTFKFKDLSYEDVLAIHTILEKNND